MQSELRFRRRRTDLKEVETSVGIRFGRHANVKPLVTLTLVHRLGAPKRSILLQAHELDPQEAVKLAERLLEMARTASAVENRQRIVNPHQ